MLQSRFDVPALTDRGSFEEGRVGWRRGMKDTVAQQEVDGEDGEDGEEQEKMGTLTSTDGYRNCGPLA
jgi:hypothetical protein